MTEITWRATTWGEVGTLKYGRSLRDYRDGGGSTQVFGTNGPIGWTTADALADGPRPVIGRKGAYRGVHLARGPFWVIDTAFWLEPEPGLDPTWAYFKLLTVDINGMDSGSAIPSLTKSQFEDAELDLPPRAEQRRIASVLGALDDLIETDSRLIDLIDCQADALFAESSAQNSTAEIVELAELVARGALVLSDGYRTRTDQLGESGIPILRVADVLDGEITPSYKDRIQEDFRAKMGVKVSKDHDVVITTKGTVGRIALVPPGFPEHVYSPQLCFLRATESANFSSAWLYRWVRSPEFLRQIGLVKDQTDMAPYVSLTDLRRVEMTLPSAHTLDEITSKLAPLTNATEALREEISELTSARNELLPLLMSGKLRVSEDLVLQ